MSKILVTEEFLDTYEGEVLFLSQDLEELIAALESDIFTQETLSLLNQKMLDVSDVFLSSSYTQHVSPIFNEFAAFILLMKCDMLRKHKNSLEYLHEIVADVNSYINLWINL